MVISRDLPGDLSRLDVVRTAELVPLTTSQPRQVHSLARHLESERILRHPLLVIRLDEHRVVIDGNARLEAARQIELQDILIQHIPIHAVPDPLRLPAISVAGVGEEEIIRVSEAVRAESANHRESVLQIRLRSGEIFVVHAQPGHPEMLWESYRRMVTALQSVADVETVTQASRLRESRRWPEPMAALITPPLLDLTTLEVLVKSGVRLPTGVLQLPVPRRILGINLSIDVLQADEPPAEKAAFVRELVRLRLSERRIHYYDAPIYIVED